jgi:hypothetical protein
MDTDRIPKQALKYRPKGKRNLGRPRKRWKDQFHLEGQRTDTTPNILQLMMMMMMMNNKMMIHYCLPFERYVGVLLNETLGGVIIRVKE